MASFRLSHNDYAVAWICALPLEMAAAKAMIDEIHEPLPQPLSDHNAYTLGRLCGHTVVIACLPSGIYGITSAATVLAQMLPTFPSLQFGLMVGIGGGVPGPNDIRLGDVVVSKPTASSSGVVQYDYGKTLSDGQFERTGSLNKPPQVLLTAISQIQSEHMSWKRLIQQTIDEALAKNESMRSQFSRPRDDWLFRANHNHQNHTHECSDCDFNQLIDRPARMTDEPQVHYGLIASGNQVMKDAKTRDQIAQELDILCFEMEAAGLMDQLPCLIIRGICDYCDSHKNKGWQGFASLTAAAYARELLGLVPKRTPVRSTKQHWVVPFLRNPRFVGRQDIITKLEDLILRPNGPRKIAITGLGGVGKTQVLLELAYRMRDRDPQCSVLWIASVSSESVEQAYMTIAQQLALPDVSPANAKTRVQTHLSHENLGKWLLLYDNADDFDMWMSESGAAPALKSFLPQSENGHIIFTTRNRKLAQKLAPFNILSVPEMDPGTAREVLQKSLLESKHLEDDTTTTTILQQLTFLPLAITQAAAYINANGIQLSDYLALLAEQQEKQDFVELLGEDFEDDGRYAEIHNPVATTWSISFRQIQQLDSLAADYLSFMACISPRDIPLSLLPPAGSRKKEIDALGLLNAYSFTSNQEDGHLSLHRLVHLAMRSWMKQSEILDFWVCQTANRIEGVFPDDNYLNRSQWRQYLPHALFLISREEFQSTKVQRVIFLNKVGRCLMRDGRYDEAEVLFSDILDVMQMKYGRSHPSTLTSMSNLAWTYQNQGRSEEAGELGLQVMEIRKQVLGADHPNTLISMGNLTTLYQKQRRWKEAEELGTRVMESLKQVLGAEHPDTLMSMHNLTTLYQKQRRWKDAEDLGTRVMESLKQVLGAEHPDTLSSMHNLTSTYQMQGRWNEAEELGTRVVESRKKVLGIEHPNTLISMGNLALTYQKQGKWGKTEELEVQVLKSRQQVLGFKHPATLAGMGNLALTYQEQRQWKKAEELEIQVLKSRQQVLGLKHPDTLTAMGNLARTYQRQGQWKKAEELEVQVMGSRKQMLGAEHPDTLLSMHNLAVYWKLIGKVKDAVHLMTSCIQLCTKVLGPNHPDTICSIEALAEWQTPNISLHDITSQALSKTKVLDFVPSEATNTNSSSELPGEAQVSKASSLSSRESEFLLF